VSKNEGEGVGKWWKEGKGMKRRGRRKDGMTGKGRVVKTNWKSPWDQ